LAPPPPPQLLPASRAGGRRRQQAESHYRVVFALDGLRLLGGRLAAAASFDRR